MSKPGSYDQIKVGVHAIDAEECLEDSFVPHGRPFPTNNVVHCFVMINCLSRKGFSVKGADEV